VKTNLVTDLTAVTGISATQAADISGAVALTDGQSNNLMTVIPEALSDAITYIGANITDATAAAAAKDAVVASLLGSINGSTSLTASGRTVSKVSDISAFEELLSRISATFVTLASNSIISTSELSSMIAAVNNSLDDAGADDSQISGLQNTFNGEISSDVSSNANLVTGGYLTVVQAATGVASGSTTGKSYSLTTGYDELAGDSNGNKFTGILSGALATGSTVQPGDSIDGSGGIDEFIINISGDAGGAFNLSSVTTNNVEKILVSNYDANGGVTTIDMSAMANVTHLGTVGSSATGDTIFSNVLAIAEVQAKGSGDITVSYPASVVSGTTDNQTLAVDTFTGAATFTEVETLNINASGSASTISTLTTDGGTQDTATLNINASANLTITTDLNTNNSALTKIDGTGSTGKITLTTADTGTTNITLGSGDDKLVRNANAAADTVNAGDGTDTLSVTTGANATSAKLANYSNFETLELTGAAGATVALSGVTGFNKVVNADDSTGTTTITGAGSNITTLAITVAGGTDENTSLALATNTSSDSINVEIGPASGTTAVTMGTLTLNDHETINIASAGADNSIGALTSSSATSLVATGAKDLTITAFTSSSNLKTMDASAMTGQFIMGATGAATGLTLTGGAGADTLRGGSGTDNMTGGAGADSIDAAGGNDIIAGGDGNDLITIDDAGTYNVDAGAGDDTVTIDPSNIGNTDTVAGGAGAADTLKIITAAFDWNDAADATDLANVSGFEKVEIGFQATSYTLGDVVMGLFSNEATVNSKVAGAVSLDASSVLTSTNKVNFNTTSTSNNVHTYTISNGIDNVNYSTMGTASANVVKVTNALYLQSTDSFQGSSNTTESLVFDTDGAITITAAQLGGLAGIETISVNNTNTKSGAAKITLSDAIVTANKISSTGVFAVSRDTDESGTLHVDGSAVTSGNLSITGADGADTLVGGSGNDTLQGDQGTGSTTADQLTGGAGNDTFMLVDDAAVDVITDMNFGTSSTTVDKLGFDDSELTAQIAGATAVTMDTSVDTVTVGTATSVATATDVLVITDQTYADATALDTAMENINGVTPTNDFIVIYQDTLGNVRIAVTGDVAGVTLSNSAADIEVYDLAKISGMSLTSVYSSIDTGDFLVQD